MQECGTISHHHIRPDPTPPAMVSKSSCCSILRPPHNLKDVMMRQNNSNRGRNLCYDSKKLLPSLMPPPMPVNKSDLPAAHCPCQDERRVRVLWLCCCCWWNICISEPVASNYPADRRPHLRAVLLFSQTDPLSTVRRGFLSHLVSDAPAVVEIFKEICKATLHTKGVDLQTWSWRATPPSCGGPRQL